MNKEKALQQLKELESKSAEIEVEVAKLRKIIEAPDPAPSLLTKPVPGGCARYWTLSDGGFIELVARVKTAVSGNPNYYTHGNIFQSEELAQAYADAIDTMLMLRHQPGTCPPSAKKNQWMIWPSDEKCNSLEFFTFYYLASKCSMISPCFNSKDDALQAIEVVGKTRILNMFKTFHGIE